MTIELIAVEGIAEVRPGDDIAELIAAATEVRRGDCVNATSMASFIGSSNGR